MRPESRPDPQEKGGGDPGNLSGLPSVSVPATRVSPLTTAPPTIASVDLSALTSNLRQARRLLSPGCDILAVVKADAYGHGSVAVTEALAREGVTRFAVATIQEGAQLRDAGIQAQILVMGALPPAQLADLLGYDLTPVIYEPTIAVALAARLGAGSNPYPVHLKVDTGMGRLGLPPDQVLPLLQSPAFQSSLRLEGLMTHLADADNADPAYTKIQIERFQAVLAGLHKAGLSVPLIHAANSAAMLGHPAAHFNLVRPGIMLYGYSTALQRGPAATLKPVLSLRSQVAQVRNLEKGDSASYNRSFIARRSTKIAVLPIGYADGYSRALSNRGYVLVQGQRCPVVGRVCMDMTLLDVTDLPVVRPGDEAVLIGRQGTDAILASDVAAWSGTIPYEVLCGIGPRVPRVYS
ncbi:MAG: alanine racemase [Nitrospira sp.]|nr:alanine racemase [Nitrospira sp.]